MTSLSPIAQFRSKVQWYLDGNTPNFAPELLAELLVALKLLGSEISGVQNENAIEFFSFISGLSVKSLSDGQNFNEVVARLASLNSDADMKMSDRRSFRDAVVQLILVAEQSNDLGFRKAVLDLAQAIV